MQNAHNLCAHHTQHSARRAAKRGVSVAEQQRRDYAAEKLKRRNAYEKRCAARGEVQVTSSEKEKLVKNGKFANRDKNIGAKRKRETVVKREVKMPKPEQNVLKKIAPTKEHRFVAAPTSEDKKVALSEYKVSSAMINTSANGWAPQADESVVQANAEVNF